MEHIDFSLVDWSRWQFALTALYHWLFVPLTLGLSVIIAIMETLYVKTGNPEWKRITKFWMSLFGINFAIGVATGIILEFEFGTNWSNYSWFVGDIFGAPLAIEGIMAFFMESTFIAIMFFGWNKVSKKTHLVSSWLVAIGSNLSALWILVANAWMQNPVGMKFNPDTVRNEMENFWEIVLSPVAVSKFLHTVTSGYVLASLFVIGISAWYLLKKKNINLAKRSIVVAATFGLLSSLYLLGTGDSSAKSVAKYQPMKLAAMEGLYHGTTRAPLILAGILSNKNVENKEEDDFIIDLQIPVGLSILAFGDMDAFVPGIYDLVHGNKEHNIISYEEKIAIGKKSIDALSDYRKAKKSGDIEKATSSLKIFEDNYKYFGFGYYFGHDPHELIPNVKITFYAFHIMVGLGTYFIAFFALMLFLTLKNRIIDKKLVLWTAVWTIPLGYIAQETGWIVAEVGRQPWVIQNLMPTIAAVSKIDTSSVMVTFMLFTVVFTLLLIAEIKIMLRAIKDGPGEIEKK